MTDALQISQLFCDIWIARYFAHKVCSCACPHMLATESRPGDLFRNWPSVCSEIGRVRFNSTTMMQLVCSTCASPWRHASIPGGYAVMSA